MFGITDDNLIVGYNELSRKHHKTVDKVLQICRKANLKLSKEKCHFRCSRIHFSGKVISWDSTSPDHRKLGVLVDMSLLKCTKEIQSFLVKINYLSKLLLATAEVFEALRRLILVKAK